MVLISLRGYDFSDAVSNEWKLINDADVQNSLMLLRLHTISHEPWFKPYVIRSEGNMQTILAYTYQYTTALDGKNGDIIMRISILLGVGEDVTWRPFSIQYFSNWGGWRYILR